MITTAASVVLVCLIPTQTPITTPEQFRACGCRAQMKLTEPPRFASSSWGRNCPANVGTSRGEQSTPVDQGNPGEEPIDRDDHSEDPNRDPAKYESWKQTGVWPK